MIFLCPTGSCNRAGIPTHFPIAKARAPNYSAAFIPNASTDPASSAWALGQLEVSSAHAAVELWTIWCLMQHLHKTVHPIQVTRQNKKLKGKTGCEKTFVMSLQSFCTEKSPQFFRFPAKVLFFYSSLIIKD